jgi:hypothetical protein
MYITSAISTLSPPDQFCFLTHHAPNFVAGPSLQNRLASRGRRL